MGWRGQLGRDARGSGRRPRTVEGWMERTGREKHDSIRQRQCEGMDRGACDWTRVGRADAWTVERAGRRNRDDNGRLWSVSDPGIMDAGQQWVLRADCDAQHGQEGRGQRAEKRWDGWTMGDTGRWLDVWLHRPFSSLATQPTTGPASEGSPMVAGPGRRGSSAACCPLQRRLLGKICARCSHPSTGSSPLQLLEAQQDARYVRRTSSGAHPLAAGSCHVSAACVERTWPVRRAVCRALCESGAAGGDKLSHHDTNLILPMATVTHKTLEVAGLHTAAEAWPAAIRARPSRSKPAIHTPGPRHSPVLLAAAISSCCCPLRVAPARCLRRCHHQPLQRKRDSPALVAGQPQAGLDNPQTRAGHLPAVRSRAPTTYKRPDMIFLPAARGPGTKDASLMIMTPSNP
ncbi:hypothetical protein IQ07DRAFT_656190 [Pyrenochaeta sp. DS3sAY3a]|nr:hypothetical protein IQ07DRAFT_656190 [Pyrenochaeta sp. DS3sAY3a]